MPDVTPDDDNDGVPLIEYGDGYPGSDTHCPGTSDALRPAAPGTPE